MPLRYTRLLCLQYTDQKWWVIRVQIYTYIHMYTVIHRYMFTEIFLAKVQYQYYKYIFFLIHLFNTCIYQVYLYKNNYFYETLTYWWWIYFFFFSCIDRCRYLGYFFKLVRIVDTGSELFRKQNGLILRQRIIQSHLS